MEVKQLEIRDSGTFIPALAVQVSGDDGYLCRAAGYGQPLILLMRLGGGDCRYDPYQWPNRTMHNAHKHIAENWDALKSGDVVDVEFILGETSEVKISQQHERY